jgi:hypothetical protein
VFVPPRMALLPDQGIGPILPSISTGHAAKSTAIRRTVPGDGLMAS